MTRPLGSRYELIELIARGATGSVWRAVVRGTDARVAVKLLRDELAADPAVVDRFLRERHVLAAVRHPAVLRVRDLVAEGDELGLVMDLVDGVDLRRHLTGTGPLAPATAADIAAQAAAALTAAHAVGVVHSDVKPANILVPADGGPIRLADFGVARLTRGPAAISYGTPNYVAPEVVVGHASIPPSDVYGLGIVLYEMLTGAPPYRGGEPAEVLRRHLECEPLWTDAVPDPLRLLLEPALRRAPGERPSAETLAAGLRAALPALAGVPASRPPSKAALLHRPAARRPPVPPEPDANVVTTRLSAVAGRPASPATTVLPPATPGAAAVRPPRRRWVLIAAAAAAAVLALGATGVGLAAAGVLGGEPGVVRTITPSPSTTDGPSPSVTPTPVSPPSPPSRSADPDGPSIGDPLPT